MNFQLFQICTWKIRMQGYHISNTQLSVTTETTVSFGASEKFPLVHDNFIFIF